MQNLYINKTEIIQIIIGITSMYLFLTGHITYSLICMFSMYVVGAISDIYKNYKEYRENRSG